MNAETLVIGDKVRIIATPQYEVLTVRSIYLQGDVFWAACSWKPKAQELHFPVSKLERVT